MLLLMHCAHMAGRKKGRAEDAGWRVPYLSLLWGRSSLRSPVQLPPTPHWPDLGHLVIPCARVAGDYWLGTLPFPAKAEFC